jgi:hypothetical protein
MAFLRVTPTVLIAVLGSAALLCSVAVNRGFMLEVLSRARELKAADRSADDAKTIQSELQAKHPEWPRAQGLAWAPRAGYSELP